MLLRFILTYLCTCLRLFLAYLQPIEDKSMETLKTVDTTPINLYDCFKAFVREDQLGEEESWSVPHLPLPLSLEQEPY